MNEQRNAQLMDLLKRERAQNDELYQLMGSTRLLDTEDLVNQIQPLMRHHLKAEYLKAFQIEMSATNERLSQFLPEELVELEE